MLMESLYGMLDRNARAWWYFRELRDVGKGDEARRLERKSIRGTVEMLREALANRGLLYCGRGGFTLEYSGNGRLSGYDCDHMIAVCIRVGIPVVDTRGMNIYTVLNTLRLPMAAFAPKAPDPAPYSSISYAPIEYVLTEYERRGASVSWGRIRH